MSPREAPASYAPPVGPGNAAAAQTKTYAAAPVNFPAEAAAPLSPKPEKGSADRPVSDEERRDLELDIQGLNEIEKGLVTILENAPEEDHEKRHSLQLSLDNIRREKAALELRISPNIPGVSIHRNPLPPAPARDLSHGPNQLPLQL